MHAEAATVPLPTMPENVWRPIRCCEVDLSRLQAVILITIACIISWFVVSPVLEGRPSAPCLAGRSQFAKLQRIRFALLNRDRRLGFDTFRPRAFDFARKVYPGYNSGHGASEQIPSDQILSDGRQTWFDSYESVRLGFSELRLVNYQRRIHDEIRA
jgi:hypothetical protein